MKTLRRHRRSLLATFVFVLTLGLAVSGVLFTAAPVAADCSGFVPCLPGDKGVGWCHGDCCKVRYCTSQCEWGPWTYQGC